jgi:hypothetical protein
VGVPYLAVEPLILTRTLTLSPYRNPFTSTLTPT